MDFKGRRFRENKTGKTIKVIDSFENIVILENKTKIDASILLNPELYTEEVDIENLFNLQDTYSSIANKIKSIPLDNVPDDDGEFKVNVSRQEIEPISSDSAIIMVDEEYEKAELAKKYSISNPSDSLTRQNEAFAKLLGNADELPAVAPPVPTVSSSVIPATTVASTKETDPIIAIFKNAKRNINFSISFEINDKIPRLDFIEMMEDSYNISIIDYIASEFTDRLMKDPSVIRNKIRDKIREMIDSNNESKKETPKRKYSRGSSNEPKKETPKRKYTRKTNELEND